MVAGKCGFAGSGGNRAQIPGHVLKMWSLRKPSDAELADFLKDQANASYSYAEVGATARDEQPRGFRFDNNRVLLGDGDEVFRRAVAAISRWQHFETSWTQIIPPDSTISCGATVALLIRALGVWWWNSARIVYTVDEQHPTPRFGFAYGTLPAHVERGEEQFLVEMGAAGEVWYSIRSFSHPRVLAARIASPIARRLQRQFVHDSFAAMAAAVGGQ
jgi:uncharacterized protein (UPF0548 family)